MRSGKKVQVSVHKVVQFAALCFFLCASTGAAQVMYMVGDISGTVNGTPVDFDVNIKLDMKTGEETATVGNMDPEMGAILRQVPAMVTVGGPTGGATLQGSQNLFTLSGGNFVNAATVFWPKTGDKLELIHTVSYAGGDTMMVSATINGTVPVIDGNKRVAFQDFTEIMHWGSRSGRAGAKAAQAVTTGVGFRGDFSKAKFRSYAVGDKVLCPDPTDPTCEQEGKGSTTMYMGFQPTGAVLRSARDITITYDPQKSVMNVHLYNSLAPIEDAREHKPGDLSTRRPDPTDKPEGF